MGGRPWGILLADAGFDAGKVYEEAKGKFTPMVRLKGGGEVKDAKGREALEAFHPELYRLWAVGEGIFGAKRRLNGRLRNLLLSQTQKEALLLVVSTREMTPASC